MHVTVNGARLFFDVDGAKLVPDGKVMRERPTVLLLHGGPGRRSFHLQAALLAPHRHRATCLSRPSRQRAQ